MSEWKEYKASEYCMAIADGTHDSPKETKTGPFLVTSKHLTQHGIDFSKAYHISFEDYEKIIKRSKVDDSDILFSMIGTIGNIVLVHKSEEKYAVKNMGIFKCGGDYTKSKWLYYWLQSPQTKTYLNNVIAGSTQGYVTLHSLRELPIRFPAIEKAKKIVLILSSLDEKIETNRKINARLEELAKALFKSWFIDFEPFGGKMPEDWESLPLNNLVETTIGGDWGKEEEDGKFSKKVLCIRGADLISIRIGEKGKTPARYILEKNFKQKVLSHHDIIVEISGGSPTQSTGRIAMISSVFANDYDNSLICTNFCKALKIKEPYSQYFYYLWNNLYDNKVMFIYENGSNGLKNLNLTNLLEREICIIPSEKAAFEFFNVIEPIFLKIQKIGAESSRLTALRDTLLPKLMSGELIPE